MKIQSRLLSLLFVPIVLLFSGCIHVGINTGKPVKRFVGNCNDHTKRSFIFNVWRHESVNIDENEIETILKTATSIAQQDEDGIKNNDVKVLLDFSINGKPERIPFPMKDGILSADDFNWSPYVGNSGTNVLVVNKILRCRGLPGSFDGCSPGANASVFAVVRLKERLINDVFPSIGVSASEDKALQVEGNLWLHEFAHTKGLCHGDEKCGLNQHARAVMNVPIFPILESGNTFFSENECKVLRGGHADKVTLNDSGSQGESHTKVPVEKFVQQIFIDKIPMQKMLAYAKNEKDIASLVKIFKEGCNQGVRGNYTCSHILPILGLSGREEVMNLLLSFIGNKNIKDFNLKADAAMAIGLWINQRNELDSHEIKYGKSIGVQKGYSCLINLLNPKRAGHRKTEGERLNKEKLCMVSLPEEHNDYQGRDNLLTQGAIIGLGLSASSGESEFYQPNQAQEALEALLSHSEEGSSFRALILRSLRDQNKIALGGLNCLFSFESKLCKRVSNEKKFFSATSEAISRKELKKFFGRIISEESIENVRAQNSREKSLSSETILDRGVNCYYEKNGKGCTKFFEVVLSDAKLGTDDRARIIESLINLNGKGFASSYGGVY